MELRSEDLRLSERSSLYLKEPDEAQLRIVRTTFLQLHAAWVLVKN